MLRRVNENINEVISHFLIALCKVLDILVFYLNLFKWMLTIEYFALQRVFKRNIVLYSDSSTILKIIKPEALKTEIN